MNLTIFPYKMGSMGARDLAKALGVKRAKNEAPKIGNLVLNWGNSSMPEWGHNYRFLNHPAAVCFCTNKTRTFNALYEHGVPVPWFTTSKAEAEKMNKTSALMVRHLVSGAGGKGCEYLPTNSEVPDAPLYVEFIDKKHEYRVHVFDGEVIDVREKRRSEKLGTPDPYVWNHGHGYVFCRESVHAPQEILEAAIKAISCLGLTFGAVDCVVGRGREPYILEVNTAPGLAGSTINNYAEAVQRYIKRHGNNNGT